MTYRKSAVVSLALFAAVVSPAQAATFVLTGTLSGANEVPVIPSPGTGTAVVTLDDVANTLTLNIVFSGLLGNTTSAHIHCCAPLGTNAGVATTVPAFAGFPLGVTSGSYLQTLDLNLSTSYNPAFVTTNGSLANARTVLINGLKAGQTYLNIHTSQYGGGEIRTQLTAAVPEPATWATMIAGFGVVGGVMRLGRKRVVKPAVA